jgi:hypothetical protein
MLMLFGFLALAAECSKCTSARTAPGGAPTSNTQQRRDPDLPRRQERQRNVVDEVQL